MTPTPESEIVQKAVSTASVLNHLKNNRLEYLIALGLLHIIGVVDTVWSHVHGVCF